MTMTSTSPTYMQPASLMKLSVARYQKMIEAGILTPDDEVELLENYLVLKVTRNPPHDSVLQRMLRPLLRLIPVKYDLRIQSAITLADSQPEPDGAVVLAEPASYQTRHPSAADVALVIEVADSSLLRDRRDKTRIYARAGIPVYWLVNLVNHRVEVYSAPSGPTEEPAYGSVQTCQPGDTIPLILDGGEVGGVAVLDLMPPAEADEE